MIKRAIVCDGCGRILSINSAEARDEYIRRGTNRLNDGKYEYYLIKPVKAVFNGTVDTDAALQLCGDCMENVLKNCNYIRELRKETE